MADTAIAITAGSGTNIDTRTESTNGNHRQVIVLGDPSSNTAVAAVKDASTAPVATDPALVVAISPNSQNANGQATMANSTPTVIASDQSAIAMKMGFKTAQLSSASVSSASSGDNTLVTRSVGTIKVYGLFVAGASSTAIKFRDGASDLTGAMTCSSIFLPLSAEPYFTTSSTNNFILNLGSAVQWSGRIYYLDN